MQIRFRDRMQSLLEVAGGKVLSIEDFDSNSQDVLNTENNCLVLVTPAASMNHSCQRGSLSKVNESSLLSSIISGHLDPSILISPSIAVSSSCSTDDTIVADSNAETETDTETATSDHPTTANTVIGSADMESEKKAIRVHASLTSEAVQVTDLMKQNNRTTIREQVKEATKYESSEKKSLDYGASLSENGQPMNFLVPNRAAVRRDDDDLERGNLDILYSQSLIVRDTNPRATTDFLTESGVINFKRFRKTNTLSGNSFTNLVPFSKYPYSDSDYDKEISEYMKEEKKRKQAEAMAEDLFNHERGRRRGAAGSLQGLLSRR